MTIDPLPAGKQPYGLIATAVLGFVAMFVSQLAALSIVMWRDPAITTNLAKFDTDGVAVALLIIISTPLQIALLALFVQNRGGATNYLALKFPSRGEVMFGVASVVAFVVVGDALSWFLGKAVITPFQSDIYRTASVAGWLPLLLLAVVVVGPIGEETLFRGFLFRGWLRSPRTAWPVIIVTALLWSVIHVQYDWFVISQIFVSGLLLGWLRWASGSTILTILLHMLVNFEGMLETYVALHG